MKATNNHCNIHGDLTSKDMHANGDCAFCRRAASKKWRDNHLDIDRENQKKYREKANKNKLTEKICKNHGKITAEFIGSSNRCLLCARNGNKKTYNKNACNWASREHEKRRELYAANKERFRSYGKKYETVNKERYRSLRVKRNNKAVEILSDGYVKQNLSRKLNISRTEIPKELIDVERVRVKILRLFRQKYGTTRCPK